MVTLETPVSFHMFSSVLRVSSGWSTVQQSDKSSPFAQSLNHQHPEVQQICQPQRKKGVWKCKCCPISCYSHLYWYLSASKTHLTHHKRYWGFNSKYDSMFLPLFTNWQGFCQTKSYTPTVCCLINLLSGHTCFPRIRNHWNVYMLNNKRICLISENDHFPKT